MNNYQESELWKIIEQGTSAEVLGKIQAIIKKTIPLLAYIKTSFPTYTNHDSNHSLKIIKNIEMLLGDKIEHLSEAESAIILLSAYWHDLGMACEDIQQIKNESWFKEYQTNNPKKDYTNISPELASDYLRQYHHKRLELFLYEEQSILNHIDNKRLLLQEHDIVDIAYKISISHNDNTENISILKKYNAADSNDDFVFCAILLRLGDILDFDQERVSTSVYTFLGLDHANTNSKKISKEEWDKHLESLGFKYKNDLLYFSAVPSNPNIEHKIRSFIQVINFEIEKCKDVFGAYCKKWREDFKLPKGINVDGIRSQNYKFGDFNFTLDNNKILNLLIGENIYSNQTIFVRELLQNSIDASLYRQAVKKKDGIEYKCEPINIIDWYDDKGNYWIRFDDYGIGMDEYILLNYFTKIGVSFYESKDFDATTNFKAISRFGIGILSCFMIADRVEISTKKENSEAIRSSINSLHSYFITQFENDHKNLTPFPAPQGYKNEKYREKIGTSIAIQIDFTKMKSWINIKQKLLDYIFYSPIEIQYKHEKIGTTLDELDTNPWLREEKIIQLDEIDTTTINAFFDLESNKDPYEIKIRPINLSQYSTTPKIKAQMILIEMNESLLSFIDNKLCEISFDRYSYIYDKNTLSLKLNKRMNEKILSEKIILTKYNEVKNILPLNYNTKISHNGILFAEDFSNSYHETLFNFTSNQYYCIMHISLADEYRPMLDISRSKEAEFDYSTLSAANLMLSKFITESSMMNKSHDCSLIRNRFQKEFSYKAIIEDNLLLEWQKEKLFQIKENEYSNLIDIKQALSTSTNIQILNYPRIDHYHVDYIYKPHTRGIMVNILLSLFTDGFLNEKGKYFITNIYETKKEEIYQQYFPMGFFVKYSTKIQSKLQITNTSRYNYSLNFDHMFSKWLIHNAELLHNHYRGIFEDIKRIFIYDYKDTKKEQLISSLSILQQLNSNIVNSDIIESIKF